MKAIDDKAKPVLEKLICGEVCRLTPSDQQIIASWCALKSIVSQHDDSFRLTTHHMQRKRLMIKGLPPKDKMAIWIGSFERVTWMPEWTARPMLILSVERSAKRNKTEATYFNSNSITQVIGKLYVHVISVPMSDIIKGWRFSTPNGGTLFRIWPPSTYSIAWPGKVLSDQDADYISNAFGVFADYASRSRRRQISIGLTSSV